MIALVATESGTFGVDLESGELEPAESFVADPPPALNLPRVLAAAESGSTIVAVVAARPPMLVSYDAGATWRESGRGLPAGVAVAIADWNPDVLAYASRNRVYVSTNGGVFWSAVSVELPAIDALSLRES
jgi:hypothetical protein